MFAFFANMFGYILNFIYEIVQNYGLAIIIFTIIIKLAMLPMTIKQQKTLEKSKKLQEKMKELQFKYKNNPEMLNKETMALYKSENMSPFSGCFSSIIQLILLLSVFFLVQSPLTYMRKVEPTIIEDYKTQLQQQGTESNSIKYPEIRIIQENGAKDERVYINMEFLGLDLSLVPISDMTDYRVYIIPALYVISSIVSMRLTANIKKKKKEEGKEETNEMDALAEANKNMMYIMPVMSVSISLIAPLGLALYWLVNNLLIIIEKILMNKFLQLGGEDNGINANRF